MNRIDISTFLAQAEPETKGETALGDWDPPHLWQWIDNAQGEPEYLFKDLIPADSKILFSGKAKKAFKSWMAYAIGLAAASGKAIGPLVPVNPDGVPVLALAAEGGKAQNRNRFQWLEKGFGVDSRVLKNFRFSFKEPILLDDQEWVYRVKRFVAKHGIKLVILDPLVMFMRGDENKVHEVSKIMRAINDIGASGATVLFVHHLNKTQKDWNRDIDEEIRGTSALAGFYDQHWAFRQKRESQKHNDLTVRSKDDEEKQFEVRWFIDKYEGLATFKMEQVTEEVSRKQLMAVVYKELIPTQEYSQKSIASISELGWEETKTLIDEMVVAGMLEAKGKQYVCKTIDKTAS